MIYDLEVRIIEFMLEFSKGQKKIVQFILEYGEKVVYMIVFVFGNLVGVSEFIVVRFVERFGFEGYFEFQWVL